jgi:hypothetical protein
MLLFHKEYNLPSLQDHINLFLEIIIASQASDNLSLKMIASKAFLSLLFEINEVIFFNKYKAYFKSY